MHYFKIFCTALIGAFTISYALSCALTVVSWHDYQQCRDQRGTLVKSRFGWDCKLEAKKEIV